MYEMKDFEDAGLMLQYLNDLPPHEVITCFFDNNKYWRVIVKITPKSEMPYNQPRELYPTLEDIPKPKKPKMVRPKGWKPGGPYVPMEDK